MFQINIFYILFICSSVFASYNHMKCKVCENLVSEILEQIEQADPDKTLERGYNIDSKSNKIKYKFSETHLTDVSDSVCETFKDYAIGVHKETNLKEPVKIMVGGTINPDMSSYEMGQDPDLGQSIAHHCNSILSEYEEEYFDFFSKQQDSIEDAQSKFCSQIDLCSLRDEL